MDKTFLESTNNWPSLLWTHSHDLYYNKDEKSGKNYNVGIRNPDTRKPDISEKHTFLSIFNGSTNQGIAVERSRASFSLLGLKAKVRGLINSS